MLEGRRRLKTRVPLVVMIVMDRATLSIPNALFDTCCTCYNVHITFPTLQYEIKDYVLYIFK